MNAFDWKQALESYAVKFVRDRILSLNILVTVLCSCDYYLSYLMKQNQLLNHTMVILTKIKYELIIILLTSVIMYC